MILDFQLLQVILGIQITLVISIWDIFIGFHLLPPHMKIFNVKIFKEEEDRLSPYMLSALVSNTLSHISMYEDIWRGPPSIKCPVLWFPNTMSPTSTYEDIGRVTLSIICSVFWFPNIPISYLNCNWLANRNKDIGHPNKQMTTKTKKSTHTALIDWWCVESSTHHTLLLSLSLEGCQGGTT